METENNENVISDNPKDKDKETNNYRDKEKKEDPDKKKG